MIRANSKEEFGHSEIKKIALMVDRAGASWTAKTCIRSDLCKYKPSLILDNFL